MYVGVNPQQNEWMRSLIIPTRVGLPCGAKKEKEDEIMNIFQIDEAIDELIDPDTGEIQNIEEFEKLEGDRKQKIENTALAYKNYSAELDALEKEYKTFARRIKTTKNKMNGCKTLLDYSLKGESFETSKCVVSYRNTPHLEVDNEQEFINWAEATNHDNMLKFRPPEISKTAVSDAIKSGEDIPYCHIETNPSVQVK